MNFNVVREVSNSWHMDLPPIPVTYVTFKPTLPVFATCRGQWPVWWMYLWNLKQACGTPRTVGTWGQLTPLPQMGPWNRTWPLYIDIVRDMSSHVSFETFIRFVPDKGQRTSSTDWNPYHKGLRTTFVKNQLTRTNICGHRKRASGVSH